MILLNIQMTLVRHLHGELDVYAPLCTLQPVSSERTPQQIYSIILVIQRIIVDGKLWCELILLIARRHVV